MFGSWLARTFERVELLERILNVQENLVPAFEHLKSSRPLALLVPDVNQLLAHLPLWTRMKNEMEKSISDGQLVGGTVQSASCYRK